MGKRSRTAANIGVLIVTVFGLVIVLIVLMGAVTAFLWNAVIVNSLHLTTYTLDLWTGTGFYLLLAVVGGALHSTSTNNKE